MAGLGRPLRVANCSGFYGDRLSAAREVVEGGPIDVLTGDWLAELTMLILQRERAKNPAGGYARTFLVQMEQVLATCLQRGIRVVGNAGGMNPHGLAAAVAELAGKAGLTPKIAVVDGDDVMGRVAGWMAAPEGLRHLDLGVPLAPEHGTPLAANAYLGAWGIALALERGADVVITGRTTDAAAVVGPAAWAHGWALDAWDPLAGALVAGHVIECGAQATGGNYAFFREVPRWDRPGFPIAEIAADGSSVITKHPGSAGLVSQGTVLAQLLYEIGSPLYASPDVIARFDSMQLTDDGPDRVRISGTVGLPPTDRLKAGVLLASGYRNEVSFLLGGADAAAKAEIVFGQLRSSAKLDRLPEVRSALTLADPKNPPARRLARFTVSVRSPDRDAVGRSFTAKAIELALSSVPGITLDGLPGDPTPVGVFWPCLVPRAEVAHRVHLMGEVSVAPMPPAGALPVMPPPPRGPVGATCVGRRVQVPLGRLVGARSGDKAGNANVGFWVRHAEQYAWLIQTVTADSVASWLDFHGEVRVWPLPNLLAVNVELVGYLGDGVAANLSPDPQAKCLAECLRTVEVEVDEALLELTGG